MTIQTNISEGERLIRVILGIYAMLLGFLFIQGIIGAILGIVGLIAFATGASGWCPLYTAVGKPLPESAKATEAPAEVTEVDTEADEMHEDLEVGD